MNRISMTDQPQQCEPTPEPTTPSENQPSPCAALGHSRRILIVDDNVSIHDDFQRILIGRNNSDPNLDRLDHNLFGSSAAASKTPPFDLTFASQGQEALASVQHAVASGRPFALAFVDVRMPPGWDGIETTRHLWEADPDLQVVICTAHSDYSWEEMTAQLGSTDRLVILKKPFDTMEVLQLANALTEKWRLLQQTRLQLNGLQKTVHERTEKLHQSEQFFRLITENAGDLIAIITPRGQLVYTNPCYVTGLGYSPEQLRGDAFEQVHPDDLDEVRTAWSHTLETGVAGMLEYRVRHKDGSWRFLESHCAPFRDGTGAVDGLLLVSRDLTERKSLEKQLLRAQRLESIGTLASGIAHDLNNILVPILMSADLLKLSRPCGEEAELLDSIQASARRGAEVVKQVLTFARGVEGQRGALQPKHLVREIHKFAEETFPKNITLRFDIPSNLWTVNGDATQLHQLLLNLCVNARDAMPAGGTLSVSCANLEISSPKAGLFADGKCGPHVLFSVNDTGKGIPPDVIEKIFDPFFTTKEQGKGTGLGLSTVLGIVRSHGGFLDVQSEPGRGSSFKVYLPANASEVAREQSPTSGFPPRGAGQFVLVVDDEARVREATARVLSHHGYQVLLAANGNEALDVAGAHAQDLKAVVTDLDDARHGRLRTGAGPQPLSSALARDCLHRPGPGRRQS